MSVQFQQADNGLLPCPFCGGRGMFDRVERAGYQDYPDDPDRRAHFVRCMTCAAQGGWAKSGTEGAAAYWNRRERAA